MTEAQLREANRILNQRRGKKGGTATAANRTQEERTEAARKASRARWKKHPAAKPEAPGEPVSGTQDPTAPPAQ